MVPGNTHTMFFVMFWVVVLGVFQTTNGFDLTILHTNDVHARVDQTNLFSSRCSDEDAQKQACYGGVARRATLVREIRGNYSNVLLLDAGDTFQGTPWFSYYNGSEASHFMNRMGYDAMVSNLDHEPQKCIVHFIKYYQST